MLDIARDVRPRCWMYQGKSPICYVVLGRFGDLMILLSGLKALYDSTGTKPVVIVGREFACLFNGVTYALAHPVMYDVYRDVRLAVDFAIRTYGDCIVPKWWDDPRKKPPPVVPPPWFDERTPKPYSGKTVSIIYQNQRYTLPKEDWENYMVSQWEHAGFTREQMMEWPLVFDKRDPNAEAALANRIFRTSKPKLLYNFGGVTSPLPKGQVVAMTQMINRLSAKFEIINLAQVRANCIYDLLGLYDRAAGVISTDTATLHLARASKTPYVGLIADSGSGSVTFQNCVLRVRYHRLAEKRQEIFDTLNKFA